MTSLHPVQAHLLPTGGLPYTALHIENPGRKVKMTAHQSIVCLGNSPLLEELGRRSAVLMEREIEREAIQIYIYISHESSFHQPHRSFRQVENRMW